MADPSFANVTTLLPCDEEVSGATPDLSPAGATWSLINGAAISDTQSKFGGFSADIGSGTYLECTDATLPFDVQGESALQLWIYVDAIGADQTLLETGGLFWGITSGGALEIQAVDGSSSSVVSATSSGTISAATWTYVELSRDASGDWRQFIGGTLQNTVSESGSVATGFTMQIGRKSGFMDLRPFVGFVDDIRIASEVVNTANYTPPTAAHPTSSGNPDLLISVPSPLGAAALLTRLNPDVRISVPSPLGAPAVRFTQADARSVRVSVPSPLGQVRVLAQADFTALIDDPVQDYVVHITGDPVVVVPVSSWQATLQTERQNFVQVVIPAAAAYVDALSTRRGVEEFIVYRRARVGGTVVESEMARASIDTVSVNAGPQRYTATVQGYTSAFDAPVAPGTVTLREVRQRSQTLGGSARVRCAIDWLLRPGQEVTDGTITFTAGYINYFVPSGGDVYMDVGSRG